MVTFQHVSFSYEPEKSHSDILEDLSFHVKENCFIAILGPSGCGKSTILSLICRLYIPQKGEIILNNKLDAPGKIGYMLQSDHLLEWRTIIKNVCLGIEIQRKKTKESIDYANTLLEKYGLKQYKHQKPSSLSGGMRQRAALIRTLVLKPELLLLDEPFSALDYQTRLDVSNDIYTIIQNEKKTAILVTHDISEAVCFADTVIILSDRPCKIKKIIQIHFNNAIDMKEKRNASDFQKNFDMVREAIEA